MSSYAGKYIGSTPQHYDEFLGPLIFVDYAADIAQRVAAGNPARVLETAAGTGIVTRKLRDALPARAHLTATDLNPPMHCRAHAGQGNPGRDSVCTRYDLREPDH